MKNKNKKLLNGFVKYCEKNPGQRFWQALRNWSGAMSILYESGHILNKDNVKEDTFYWEEKIDLENTKLR